jgi:hypothetical protein
VHLNPRIEASVPESDVMDPDRWAQTELLSWCSMGALDALRKPASRGDRQTDRQCSDVSGSGLVSK